MAYYKTVIVDTNVLIDDPSFLVDLPFERVIIPLVVIRELDELKSSKTVGHRARQVIRILDDLRVADGLYTGSLIDQPPSGVAIYDFAPCNNESNDEAIILAAKEAHRILDGAMLLSNDMNCLLIASAHNVPCSMWPDSPDAEGQYLGYVDLEVDDELIEAIHSDRQIAYVDLEYTLYPNEYVCLKGMYAGASALGIYNWGSGWVSSVGKKPLKPMGISSKNKEQTFALDALMNDSIPLVTLSGPAGTGKGYVTLAAALEKIKQGVYKKIILTRPLYPSGGQSLGYEPGTKHEKMTPWMAGMLDNLEQISPALDFYGRRDDVIEFEGFNYLRGRSLSDAFVICDEAQNLTQADSKTLITRAGQNTKIVLLGDAEQIDNRFVDKESNGLTHAINAFKPFDIAAHVHLVDGSVRSELASIASRIL